jgi:hypothetical protein
VQKAFEWKQHKHPMRACIVYTTPLSIALLDTLMTKFAELGVLCDIVQSVNAELHEHLQHAQIIIVDDSALTAVLAHAAPTRNKQLPFYNKVAGVLDGTSATLMQLQQAGCTIPPNSVLQHPSPAAIRVFVLNLTYFARLLDRDPILTDSAALALEYTNSISENGLAGI